MNTEYIANSLSATPSLFIVFVAILILDFVNYYFNPIRLSYENCLTYISCYFFYYCIMIISLIINTLIITYITGLVPQRSYLPSLWYIAFFFGMVTIATYIIMKDEQTSKITINQVESNSIGNQNESLNPPPTFMPSQKTRILLQALVVILDMLLICQLYFKLEYYPVINLKLNRFLAKSEMNLNSYIIMIVIIKTIMDSVMFMIIFTYNACNYNLPISWNV